MSERVILDCDNTLGLPKKDVDDGLALLYLLGRTDIDLLGVTTTFGNGTIDEVYAQTEQLLPRLGRCDLALARGEGERGQSATEAAQFLVSSAAAYPGEVSILATGPLGNLRAAFELDAHFFGNLKQIVCMGGYLTPLRIGWRDVKELNLSSDPEAAYLVLNAERRRERQANCAVTLMNAHTCLQAPFGLRDLRRIRTWPADLYRAIRYWLLAFGFVHCGITRFFMWDLLPAVYVCYPGLFDHNPVKVVSSVQDLEVGTLVLDGNRSVSPLSDRTRINMPTRIHDIDAFRQVLFEAWERALAESSRCFDRGKARNNL